MIVYIVCKPMGMIYAVHSSEEDAMEDARYRNFLTPNTRNALTVEKWYVQQSPLATLGPQEKP